MTSISHPKRHLFCKGARSCALRSLHRSLCQYPLSPSQQSCSSARALVFWIQVSKNVKQLKEAHARIFRIGIDQNQHLITRILEFPNHLGYARRLFDQIEAHCEDQFIWTSIIRAYSQNAQFKESIALYRKMLHGNVLPNAFTFSSVLNSCARIPSINEGRETHNRIVKSCCSSNKIMQTALLDMYAKCGAVDDARKVFDEMSERDVVSWTAMISGYAKIGLMEYAHQLFDEMPERNVVSWTAMVAGYASSGDIRAARRLFDEMPEKNDISWTAIIAGYCKSGDSGTARQIFDSMRKRDAASWASMIAGYAQNGLSTEAIELYREMREANVKPNEVAMVGVVSACTQHGDVEVANSVANYLEWSTELPVIVANSLIHMHAKCGNLDRAHRVFEKMPQRDVISYTAMITGLADHGRAQEALELFARMQREGIEANHVTFVGVLSACSHAGLVDEGCQYFEYMTKICGIIPTTEHFACMVDLLGRAGRLRDSYELIAGMACEPDAGVWGALLGACRLYCNSELGEIAAKHLFELEPENTGNYVLLSNIYASLNKWEEAASVRRMMRERGMSKSPGCSWMPTVQSGSTSRTVNTNQEACAVESVQL